jgi:hypothetical protein
MPFIWFLIFPFAILDISVEIYHRICFPLYGIPLVKRSDYIIFDRYKLNYLGEVQKLNCTYCAYMNGLLRYVTEIGAETERYWCAIKHAKEEGRYPEHHKDFIDYGDESAFREVYIDSSKKLK